MIQCPLGTDAFFQPVKQLPKYFLIVINYFVNGFITNVSPNINRNSNRSAGLALWQGLMLPQQKLLCRICQAVLLNYSFNIKAKIVFINEKIKLTRIHLLRFSSDG
jgi:hypothetical protein